MSFPILYHTDGCHLCEQAQVLLRQCHVSYRRVDIMSDEILIASFGTRIPVLQNEQGQYLDWPFDDLTIKQFLSPNESE